MSEITTDQVIEHLSNMPVIQIAGLIKQLEEKWGVKAAPVAVAAGPGAAAGAPAAAAVEQTEFSVNLVSFAAEKKIGIIKVVRELTGLGLKEAKDLVEAAPKPVKEGVSKSESAEMQKKREEARAKVELK